MSTSAPRAGNRLLRDVVTSDARRQAYLASGAWDGSTLVGRVHEHARSRPGSIAVVDLLGARRRTYAELERDALRVASFLLEAGVAPGDVVAVQLPNRYETVVVALGVLMVGGVINPMLPVYRAKELRHMLAVGRTRVMFLPDSYRGHDHVAMVGGLASEVPQLTTRVVVPMEGAPRVPDGWVPFGQVLEREPLPPSTDREPKAEEVSELIFTSGTEASPKAIMHTEQTTNFSVRTAWTSLEMDEEDVVWMPSPIGHSTGFNYGVRMALYHGLKLVLQDRWDGAEAARLIEAERCTYTLAATTFLRDVVEAAQRGAGDISSMSLFGCGGAPVPAELVRAAARQGVTVLRLYGSTEVLVATWNRRSSPEQKRIETDGCAVDGVEVQTWDGAGQPVVGEPGEIQTRGPNTCVGFFDDPERTAATFHPEGWVRSGDLASMDEDGYLTVVGRLKEIIIRGGLNIAPREIEEVLLRMPGVRAAAVIGLPHPRLGEIGCACVVPAEGVELTLESVRAHLDAAGLARFKQPERLELVDAIPMTSTGKVQKYRLVERILGRDREAAGGD
ncbi:MAG TPA: AMP-binding protein [Candidatus Dormibacteraeota bacterium]|nr:AMP-binding protein [Candidatus Dormibacteraeota bacterium]